MFSAKLIIFSIPSTPQKGGNVKKPANFHPFGGRIKKELFIFAGIMNITI